MGIKYTNIEFESIEQLVAYQKTQVWKIVPPKSVSPVPVTITLSEKEQGMDEAIKEFYERNKAKKYLAHGKRKELADKLGIPKTRLGYILKSMKLTQSGSTEKKKTRARRAPNKYKVWTEQDDRQLLALAKKNIGENGRLKSSRATKIGKEIGRTRASVQNRLFYLTKVVGR
jgi:hypothetical protein